MKKIVILLMIALSTLIVSAKTAPLVKALTLKCLDQKDEASMA